MGDHEEAEGEGAPRAKNAFGSLDQEDPGMSEADIAQLSVLPPPSWEAPNTIAKEQAAVYELPSVKTFLTELDLKLRNFQKQNDFAPSAMKELDVILALLSSAVHTAVEAEGDIPDMSDFSADSPMRAHLHNDSGQEESPFVPYQVMEKSNIAGEVVILVKHVLNITDRLESLER
jgi:hypothetical protein